MRTDRRTDKHDEANSCFCNSSNVPNNAFPSVPRVPLNHESDVNFQRNIQNKKLLQLVAIKHILGTLFRIGGEMWCGAEGWHLSVLRLTHLPFWC
jgi:hypothetical protein